MKTEMKYQVENGDNLDPRMTLIQTILMELGHGRDNTEQEVSKYKLAPINKNKKRPCKHGSWLICHLKKHN